MSKRPIGVLLEDILSAISKIGRYVDGLSQGDFAADEKTVDAVTRNLTVIGEAANRIPADFRSSHPQIKWTEIIGMRNRVVHNYFGVDVQIVWDIIHADLPALQNAITLILKDGV
jgi:uncharacterized protein with HEPN domain